MDHSRKQCTGGQFVSVLFQFTWESFFFVGFQKISIPPPQRVIGNSEEEGVLKAKIFRGKYEPKLEFPEGWGGVQTQKTLCWGSIDIFWNVNTMRIIPQTIFPFYSAPCRFPCLNISINKMHRVSIHTQLTVAIYSS